MNKPAAEFYIKFMGEIQGPFTPSQVRTLARTGRLLPDTHIRKGVEGNWVTADRVKGLSFASNNTTEKAESNSSPATPKPQVASRKQPSRLKYVLAAVGGFVFLTTIGLLAFFLMNDKQDAGTRAIAQQQVENVVPPESKAPATAQPTRRSAQPKERIAPDQTLGANSAETNELPINIAELEDKTQIAAYIFALHDMGNDKSLITKSVTAPYSSQIQMLTRAFKHTGAEVGNAILSASKVMDEASVDYQFSEILNAVLTLDVLENAKLSELLAIYAVFRSKGESHDDVVSQLHALFTAIDDKRAELQDEINSMETGRPAG